MLVWFTIVLVEVTSTGRRIGRDADATFGETGRSQDMTVTHSLFDSSILAFVHCQVSTTALAFADTGLGMCLD